MKVGDQLPGSRLVKEAHVTVLAERRNGQSFRRMSADEFRLKSLEVLLRGWRHVRRLTLQWQFAHLEAARTKESDYEHLNVMKRSSRCKRARNELFFTSGAGPP